MQLVAYGAQDVYLTGNPQITFFKVVYRRHTNFSMEAIQQTINGSAGGTGSGTVTVSRNGDLVHKVYVVNNTAGVSTATGTAQVTDGQSIFDVVDLEIGGQLIDRQNWLWREIYLELTTPESKARGVQAMTHSGVNGGLGRHLMATQGDIVIPLHFWFCNNPGLALPLIALQYHEVKIKINWGTNGTGNQVWCDYIYLDTDERRRFAQVSHEYLIEQVQMQATQAGTSQKLNFNHPVKELIWTSTAGRTYQDARLTLNGHDRFATRNETYFQLTQPLQHHTAVPGTNIEALGRPVMVAPILLPILTAHTTTAGATVAVFTNTSLTCTAGVVTNAGFRVGDILAITVGGHNAVFGQTSVDSHIVEIGSLTTTALTFNNAIPAGLFETPGNGDGLCVRIIARTQPVARCSVMPQKINCYSFALKPEEHQPSGTCNFSRIDTARLETGAAIGTADGLQIYAVNYNVLRIMSGMGGLAYSN